MNAVAENGSIKGAASLPAIGAPLGGGFYAGMIKVGGILRALIVAPKDGGEISDMRWAASTDAVPGAARYSDGATNTQAMAESGSALGAWAGGLQINGQSDWYLPSRDELELLYRNLKPTDRQNYCSFRDGENPTSEPVGYAYTEDVPAMTAAEHFRKGGAEAFEPAWYWSSTQHASNPSRAWGQYFDNGYQLGYHKSYEGRARAVRSIEI